MGRDLLLPTGAIGLWERFSLGNVNVYMVVRTAFSASDRAFHAAPNCLPRSANDVPGGEGGWSRVQLDMGQSDASETGAGWEKHVRYICTRGLLGDGVVDDAGLLLGAALGVQAAQQDGVDGVEVVGDCLGSCGPLRDGRGMVWLSRAVVSGVRARDARYGLPVSPIRRGRAMQHRPL
jgi:hypothetical protein